MAKKTQKSFKIIKLKMMKINTKVEHSNIIYLLDMEKNTASIIGNNSAKGNIIIPKSIKYESNEYIIKSISKLAFVSTEIESVEFSSDSEIQTIEGEVFSNSFINKFSIPSSLTELKEEWCFGTSKLVTINVSPENQYYKNYGDNLVIGRS